MAVRDLAKSNGVKNDSPAGKKHSHGAGDDDNESDACSDFHERVYPENVFKRVNALKNLHMDVQNIKKEFDIKVFRLEAEYHKKLTPLLKKRSEIIGGNYEPSETESKFSFKEDAPDVETLPSDGKAGIPKFWLEVLTNSSLTQELVKEADVAILEYLTDIRVVYTDNPLGFKLEFEFAENPYFSNTVLTRSYEFGEETAKEELYVNSGLSPKTTLGTEIQWKEGKNVMKKIIVTSQRNKKTGERRQVTKEEDIESFFQFFTPAVTDLSALTKMADIDTDDENTEAAAAFQEKVQRAEFDYEIASVFRTNVVPRALLVFTGEDDDVDDYSDDDFDAEDSEDEDADEPESESSEDEQPPVKKGNKGGKK